MIEEPFVSQDEFGGGGATSHILLMLARSCDVTSRFYASYSCVHAFKFRNMQMCKRHVHIPRFGPEVKASREACMSDATVIL